LPAPADPTTKPIPKDNRIVIPTADIDLPILEGDGVWVIDNGGSLRKNLWVDSPKDIGNTVVIGHRFSYAKPTGGFYYLDKVNLGDKLAIYWQGEELVYVVVDTKIVPNTAVEIEQNTADRTLTLYTCTPIFSSVNRLVVIAKPYAQENNK
jgi:LPXTG-site transpeptidase (sortase) family protein